MNNEKMRFKIKTGIDRHCAVLSPDPDRVQRVLNAAHKDGKTVVQKKTPRGVGIAVDFDTDRFGCAGCGVAVAGLCSLEETKRS